MTIAHTSEQASTALELESAPLGSIAQSIYDEDQLIIKMTSTGTPWMRDPWTKALGRERITNYLASLAGYRLTMVPASDEPAAKPTPKTVKDQVGALRGTGWTLSELARHIGVDRDRLRSGKISDSALATLMDLPISVAPGYQPPRAADRAEDLEFLLGNGVSEEEAIKRCGWTSMENATASLRRLGRNDLVARLIVEVDA